MGILRIVFWGVFFFYFFFYLFSFENISVIVLLGAELTSFPIPLLEWPFPIYDPLTSQKETIKSVHILLLPGTN